VQCFFPLAAHPVACYVICFLMLEGEEKDVLVQLHAGFLCIFQGHLPSCFLSLHSFLFKVNINTTF
jgi:hypothetical protein